MKKQKKVLSLVMIAMLFTTVSIPAFASGEIGVYLDNEKLQFDVAPLLVNGRTMVPLRTIFEKLGAVVSWDGQTRTAMATKENISVSIAIDDTTLYKNGEAIVLDVPAQLIGGRTLVPLRAVSEAFDCEVQWDGNTRTVYIFSSKEVSSEVSQEEAFRQLKNFITNYSNASINGKPQYKEVYEKDNVTKQYSLDYNVEKNLITLTTIYRGSYTSYTYIGLTANDDSFYSMFSYYSPLNKTNYSDFNGTFYIEPGNYNLSSKMSFVKKEGDISFAETYEALALMNSLEGLDFATYICKTYLSSNITLEDFGFAVPSTGYTPVKFGNAKNQNGSNYQLEDYVIDNNYREETYFKNTKVTLSSFPLYLYSDDGTVTFLGEISSNKYNANSIANEYGKYGSKYQTKSIFNSYGTYGSKYSQYSVFNEYATNPPKILDKNGKIIGYLTANKYIKDAISYEEMMVLLKKFNK